MKVEKVFRWVWGILTLLSCGWVTMGLMAVVDVADKQLGTTQAQTSAAYQAGTMLGGGISTAFFLCTGVPALLLFAFLFWRNGVAIRESKRHEETIAAMRARYEK
jgi:uncharacterized membrane protein